MLAASGGSVRAANVPGTGRGPGAGGADAFINLNMEVSSNGDAVYFYCTPGAARPNATPNLFPCILISPSE